jgi:hypothetical protein
MGEQSGINIITNTQSVMVDGAEEAIKEFNENKISREELYEKILNADVVFIDSSKFKDKDENKSEKS